MSVEVATKKLVLPVEQSFISPLNRSRFGSKQFGG